MNKSEQSYLSYCLGVVRDAGFTSYVDHRNHSAWFVNHTTGQALNVLNTGKVIDQSRWLHGVHSNIITGTYKPKQPTYRLVIAVADHLTQVQTAKLEAINPAHEVLTQLGYGTAS